MSQSPPRRGASRGMRVNVFDRALTEPRIRRVARRLSLSHYDVLGRLCHLWMLCYQRRTEFVDVVDAEIATGELPGFVDALIADELADRETEKSIRIRGVEDAIRWLEGQSERGRMSGDSRRAMSVRLQELTTVQPSLNLGSGAVEPLVEPDLISSDLRNKKNTNLPGDRVPPPALRRSNDLGNRGSGANPGQKIELTPSGRRSERADGTTGNLPDVALNISRQFVLSITKNNPSGRLAKAVPRLREATVIRWAHTIDKLHRIDGMSWDVIHQMIVWSQHDHFWRGVILGADALRENWDKMAAQQRRSLVSNGHQSKRDPTELARRELEELERKEAEEQER